jgi:hypothetical protein
LKENFDRFKLAIHKEKEMADFRRWLTALAGLALFAGMASAQVGTGGGTQAPSCSANTSNTPTLRSEGITEQVGDIIIRCTGGNLPDGTAGSLVNITIGFGTQVTTRLVAGTPGTNGVSEALLMIDEPTTGGGPVTGYGPNAPFIDCANTGPFAPAGCNAYGYHVTGSDSNVYIIQNASTSSGTPTGTPAPNLYQGVVSGNQVTFFGVPIVPPGTSGQRVYRITNVRVNASALGNVPVTASISTSNPAALPISNPTPIVGFVSPSLTASVGKVGSFVQCVSAALVPGTSLGSLITFSEANQFASAFKTRVDTTVNSSPTAEAYNQNKPGTIYYSESGFTLSSSQVPGLLTPSNYTGVGLADFGTRFQAVINNIPAGARVYVSYNNVNPGTGTNPPTQPTSTSTPAGPRATYVTSSTAPDTGGNLPTTSAAPSSTTGFLANIPVVEITPSSGTSATAVWEVTNTNPNAIDSYSFGIFVVYTAAGSNGPSGTATVAMSYAPTSTTTTASATANVPRFIDTSKATNAFGISACKTVLLFPFVTNQLGFDTGLAISNTSTDPFGTAPQQGTCTLNWYGTAAPAVTTLGSGGAMGSSAAAIASGTTTAILTSSAAPGFQGYMIASCSFQYAHGFAFVSDVGARNLAMGYLANVIPDPSTTGGVRLPNPLSLSPAGSGEQLSH